MTGIQWFVLAVIVILALGYWNWQRSNEQIRQLKASGFIVSVDLKGTPRLLVDTQAKEIAVVKPTSVQRYSFSQLAQVELDYDANIQRDENYRIKLTLRAASPSHIEILYEDEWRAEEKLKTLLTLLSNASD